MASASSYPSTASRLTSILDAPIPPAETSTQLIDLQPRVANIEALQVVHESEIAELRQRSAAVIQKWYNMEILQAGDNWAELVGRIEQVEQHSRRRSLAKRMDDDMI
jgi:DNA phosphorothioation-dependent restriction protein DptG